MPTAWNPGADSWVHSIVPNGDHVLVGGSFANVGGEARANFAEISASTGLATALDLDPTGDINVMRMVGNTLYVGGEFGNIGGEARNHLAAIDLVSKTTTA